MLPLSVIEEVRRLLDEGELSQRKIARKLGVSRGIVNSIANGSRGIYGREPDEEDLLLGGVQLTPERCPSCGAMVYKPCVLCSARAFHARQKLLGQSQLPRQTSDRRVA